MVNVDPLVLVAAGTAVVGIATIAVCALQAPRKSESRRSKREAPTQHSQVPSSSSATSPIVESAPTAKKGKKKVRSNKKKKSGNVSESPVPGEESQSEVEDVKFASKEQNIPDVDTSFNADDEDEEEDLRILSNRGNTFISINKPKKAKETPEQKAARVERQKMKDAKRAAMEEKAAAAAAKLEAEAQALSEFNNFSSAPTQPYDGWAVVEVKKSKTKLEAEAAAMESENAAPMDPVPVVEKEVPVVPAAPVVETVTQPMTVDSRKIGLLIGPKGVTKIGIQVATGANIEMPKVDKDAPATTAIVNVTGTADAVARAVHALNELCTKGYSTLLAPDDFQEGYVAIHPRFLPDVIGKGGVCIRALQQHTGVKITTPANTPRDGTVTASKIKINLAGPREKVTEARNLIKEITKYYHTPVTHPGMVHSELDIPAHYYNYIIGAKGSEIKHIQANFKVNVYIPNAESNNSNVLIVGEPANVANAEKHIHKLIEKVNAIQEQKAAAEAVAEAYREASKAARQAAAAAASNNASSITPVVGYSVGGGGKPSTARVDKDDEPKEEWMKEFERRGDGIDFSHLLPAKAKFAAPAPAPAPVAEEIAAPAAVPVVEDVSSEPVAVEEPKPAWAAAAVASSSEEEEETSTA